MTGHHSVTSAHLRKFVELAEAGFTAPEIARETGWTSQTVRRNLYALGICPVPHQRARRVRPVRQDGPSRKLEGEKRNEARDLYRAWESARRVALAMDVSPKTVCDCCRDLVDAVKARREAERLARRERVLATIQRDYDTSADQLAQRLGYANANVLYVRRSQYRAEQRRAPSPEQVNEPLGPAVEDAA